jgi:hypothetical protein
MHGQTQIKFALQYFTAYKADMVFPFIWLLVVLLKMWF